ncbi:MAG: hypothetical protein ACF8NJ_04140, partial [Phycisphaerales bacterium JB038]
NTLETGDQLDGDGSAKYNVYYAYSLDGGATFEDNIRLHEDDPDNDPIPALDEEGGGQRSLQAG